MAFGIGNGGDDDYQDIAEINIIPLVDIMLVLLIIFMVAAPLSISGIKVNLPISKAKGASVEQTRIVLSISEGGKFYLGNAEVPSSDLEKKLQAIYAAQEVKALYIRADQKVIYERVVYAMTAAKIAGVDKLAMLTTPPQDSVKR